MNELLTDIKQGKLLPNAFIFYNPIKENGYEPVYYNIEAWNILSRSLQSDGKAINLSDISNLCLKWKNAFDKKHSEKSCNNKTGGTVSYIVDIFESYRRKYTVNATILINTPSKQPQTYQHLFILERLNAGDLNLFATFRQWSLNQREQQISKLLIEDRSNKEIARILGLSINTAKVYIRFLMTKLNTTSRTGIVSQLLSSDTE